MKRKIYILIIFFYLGCNTNTQSKKSDLNSSIKTVNIDDLASVQIDQVRFLEHKALSKVGQIDSIQIAPGILSVLKSTVYEPARNDYESNLILSAFDIYIKTKLFFHKDSVLSVSPFNFNEKTSQLTFLIITSQNFDTFETTADLYLADVRSKKINKLNSNLKNSADASFSQNGDSFYFLDDNNLYKYDINQHKENLLVKFLNPEYTILRVQEIAPAKFRIAYIKDIALGKVFESDFTISD